MRTFVSSRCFVLRGGKSEGSLKHTDEFAPARITDCVILDLPKISDPRGNLTFVEGKNHIPFDIKRVFYLYDVPTGESRGAHAHRKLRQMLVCLSGSFDVSVDDGEDRALIHLNRPWKGLYVPPMIWAAEVNFDPASVCLVLASESYDEADYYRDYGEYVLARRITR